MSFQGYGLRENPKKSWKSSTLEYRCKVCGKEFDSTKALFGHMRHHSGRGRRRGKCQECGKGFRSLRALTGHMRLHSVKVGVSDESDSASRQNLVLESLTVRRKRSRTTRYKATSNSSFSSFIESSSGNEIEQEAKEMAICLMMLSRGVRNWGGFDSVSEFSENNSLSFEAKSSHQNNGIVESESGYPLCEGGESFRMKKPREEKLDFGVSVSIDVFYEKKMNECNEVDSVIASNEGKTVGLDAQNKMFYRGDELGMCQEDGEPKFVFYDAKIEEGIASGSATTFKSIEIESRDDLMVEIEQDIAHLRSMKLACKDEKPDASDAELVGDSSNNLVCTSLACKTFDDVDKNEYRCRTCNKSFQSYQALGGHQTVHRTNKSYTASKTDNYGENSQTSNSESDASCKLVKLDCVENSLKHEKVGVSGKRNRSGSSKAHKCPICHKSFSSGQALGGHKRAHLPKNSESTLKEIEIEQEASDNYDALDLNLPAKVDEVGNGLGFKSCRLGSDSKHEPVVSLIAN